jgi:hypothetical protein
MEFSLVLVNIEIKKLLENISELLIYEKMRSISSCLGLSLLFSCIRISDNKFSNLSYSLRQHRKQSK